MIAAGLRYFLEVVHTGSIADASTRLNVATSAISRQIAKLESDLGVDLFERRSRGMVPTPAGEILAAHARRSLLEEETVLSELRHLRALKTGRVRLATTEGFGLGLLPSAITSFRRHYSGIRFELKVAPPAEVTRMIREGVVDLGVTFSFAPEPGVSTIGQGRAPICAVVPRDHRFADRGAVTLADLAGEPMALPEKNTTARQIFDIACGLADVHVEPVYTSNYIGTLYAFAESGGGITIAAALTTRFHGGDRVVSVPIDAPALDQRRYEILIMPGRRLPEAVSAFADHLLEATEAL